MKLHLFFLLFFISVKAFAIGCDCEIIVHSPLTGPKDNALFLLESYQLEEYGSYKLNNQQKCRKSCSGAFKSNMSSVKMREMLLSYSRTLLDRKLIAFNCTGLTTIKYPVRVKAKLGDFNLGNVYNFTQVINYEEFCF